MTLLHDFFHAKNFQGFQRLLDASNDKKQAAGSLGAAATSGGHRPSPLNSTAAYVDVNSRDWLGRSILHLVVASNDCLEYLKLLLKHPNINVNLPDVESQWTPLHRALYHANIPAARLLLQRSDIDISLKDKEGYTAFDVYSSTLHGTKPDLEDRDAELFTWGANRNGALGLGDGNDRAHPDKVVLQPKEELAPTLPIAQRFSPIHIRDAQMSKLHTAVVTSESSGNLRVCGFGSGGRLGRGQQLQYDLQALPQFDYTVTTVALGQDHTLAVTKSGEVLSWGLNRFSQLGYVVETTSGKFDEPIQAVPKKILNPLRKEVVIGVAASKVASACWTEEDVYTWGTNNGQLGYDKQAHPIQILPRKVTKLSGPVLAMSMTDNVIACLLRTQQVECIWNDRHYRVNFPLNAFPQEIQPYRPPQALKASQIAKLAASDDLIAALSSNGEVFTFSPPSVSNEQNSDSNPAVRHPFQPQRIWALRKKFSSVQDVAIGSEGSIAICTESGHVYVRIRNTKGGGGKNFKFQRVSYLQRITHVTANSTGAFGALRVDFRPKAIPIIGNSLAQDLATIEPFVRVDEESKEDVTVPAVDVDEADEEEDREDADLRQDIAKLRALIRTWKLEKETPSTYPQRLPHGADTVITIGKLAFPAHRALLASRSKPLLDLFARNAIHADSLTIKLLPSKPGPGLGVSKVTFVRVDGISPLSLLILLHYLYSDEVLAIWDRRINLALAGDRRGLPINASTIKSDLQTLARALELQALETVLQAPVKRVPSSTIPRDLAALSTVVQGDRLGVPESLHPDVLLEFADKSVWAHSMVLRCRSAFFEGFFGSQEWTVRRWSPDDVLTVDCRHLKWHIMQYVLRFMICGDDKGMFDVLTFCDTADDVLEFMFQVMGAATEFLLDRLLLICSSIILSYLNIHNCCYILAEATHYHALELIDRVHEYMAANMESLLESRILDDIPQHLLVQLSSFISKKQTEKSKFTRTPEYLDTLFAKYWDWLASEDIPVPIVRSMKSITRENKDVSRLMKLSPPLPRKEKESRSTPAPTKGAVLPPPVALTRLTPLPQRPSGEDIFAIDMQDAGSPSARQTDSTPTRAEPAAPVWKVAGAPRMDMKALMAEAEASAPKYIVKKTSTEQRSLAATTPPNSVVLPSTPTKTPTRNPSSPWRSSSKTDVSDTSFPALGMPSPSAKRQPIAGPSNGGLSMTRPPPVPVTGPLSPSQPSTASGSKRFDVPPGTVLGPVITPTKHASKIASNSIRSASGKAWTAPPPEPVQPVVSRSPLSFAAIQAAEEELLLAGPSKDKRSLREIQEEEADLQKEADFLKWWQEEEERMKQEMAALNAYQGQGQAHSRGSGGGRKGKGHRQMDTTSVKGGAAGGADASANANANASKRKGKGKGTPSQGSNIVPSDRGGGAGGERPRGQTSQQPRPAPLQSSKDEKGDRGQGPPRHGPRKQPRKPSNKDRPPQSQSS